MTIVEKIKAKPFEQGLREALSLVSDDFGHDCHALLCAESDLFQYFGEQMLSRAARAQPEWPSEESIHDASEGFAHRKTDAFDLIGSWHRYSLYQLCDRSFYEGVAWLRARLAKEATDGK